MVHEMEMEMRDIKGWFADERKAQGRAGHGWATPKEPSPSVEVRARLLVPTRGARPSASFVPSQEEEYAEEEEGEYVEEDIKVDVNPPWSEPPRDSVTLYSYSTEDHGSS